MMKNSCKRILALALSLGLIISCCFVCGDVEYASASSKKVIVGNGAGVKPAIKVKLKSNKIIISGKYRVGKSEDGASNSKLRSKKISYKVASSCKVIQGDDVEEHMSYDIYRSAYDSSKFDAAIVIITIKNGKVVKLQKAS